MMAEDLVMMERVSDPRVSPAGDAVAYVLRETDYAANKGNHSLWLARLGGEQPERRLTGGDGNSESPRWSPDGQWLYFLSTRSGSSQLWRLHLRSGEARQLSHLPLDIGAFRLSDDGSRLAFSMEIFADCSDLSCSRRRLDERASQTGSGTLHTRLFVRHFDTWKTGSRSQLFTALLGADGEIGEPVLVSKGIDGDVPSKPFGGDEEWAFSPDGKSLVFGARVAGANEAVSTNLDLFLVAADGSGTPRNLTAGNPATDTGPWFSPDGRKLYYRSMSRAGYESDRFRLMERMLATGATREIAPGWDRSPDGIALSADGRTLFCTAQDMGQSPLFAVAVADGSVTRLTGKGTVKAISLGRTGIVYQHNAVNSPDQLFQIGLKGGIPRAVTAHNRDRLARIRFGDVEQFSFAGWNNETVYGHVVKPWNYEPGQSYPVAFIVHGGPQSSMGNLWHYRWNPAVFSGMGYAVVYIDFHGSTGYGQAFTDSIHGDWGGKPLEDLRKGWAFALASFNYLDGSRACALGASYGGYMMNWIAGNWPDAFRCLVNHAGIFDNRSMAYSTDEQYFMEWEHDGPYFEKPENHERHNPVGHVHKWTAPMLVTHGEKDFRVPPEQGIATFTALQRRGIPSQLLMYPDENHWVMKPRNSMQWHQAVAAWLQRWTGDGLQESGKE
jgi:dipeptidyl aminopeptidase/acylaminoacyl peptidase